MNKKFVHPYVLLYPTISRDGMPFTINKFLREIQGQSFREAIVWRGNIMIAKYRESPFSSMVNGSIADFPILRNYFMTHGAPQVSKGSLSKISYLSLPPVLKKWASSCMWIPTFRDTDNLLHEKTFVDIQYKTNYLIYMPYLFIIFIIMDIDSSVCRLQLLADWAL